PAFAGLVDYFYNTASPGGTSVPDLTLTKTHTGSFPPGGTGSYSLVVANRGTASTSGTVTLTDTLPTGLVPTGLSGTGWTCAIATIRCTRSDVLAAGASYPSVALTVSVASNAPASVTNTAGVSGGGETNLANNSASDPTTISTTSSSIPASDDFQSGSLNTSVWTPVTPGGGSVSVSGSRALISVPGGVNHDAWTTGNGGVRLMQTTSNIDFDVEVKFSSVVSTQYQTQGLLVEQDATNFLRFDVLQADCQTALFIAGISGSTATIYFNNRVRNGSALYLRVKRTGSTYRASYSYDGSHWTPPVSITNSLTVAKIGPFAGNSGVNGGGAPAFTSAVDYFVNRQSPPSTLDGQSYPPPLAPPVIEVWYGANQTFGSNGVPQQWVNVLGSVADYYGVSSLTYTLNGGASQALAMGENAVRLASPGHFNVEIDYASLRSGVNTVVITAVDSVGLQSSQTVNINYVTGQTWPINTAIRWTAGSNIQNLVQVVDGKWQIQGDGTVRTVDTGYDRLLALGQRNTWGSLEASAEVTINALNCHDFGVGLVSGWQGNTTLQYGVALPDQPRTGHPFPGLGWYSMESSPNERLDIYSNTSSRPEYVLVQDTSGRRLSTGQKYIFKFNVQDNAFGGSHYRLKVWPAASSEPATWDLETDGELSRGSIILAAHNADVSFGTVTVTSTASPVPDMSITKTHSGTFLAGGTGSYTLTASNVGSAGASGTVTVRDTLPAGLSATAISGAGWSCVLATVTCSRSDALAAAASYPSITLTVAIASNAAASLVNTATVSGGGETNTANNTASNPTTISNGPPPSGPVSDDFSGPALNNSLWTMVDPVGNATYSMTGTQLRMSIPSGADHDAWESGNRSFRALQSTSNSDFQVIAKFDTMPSVAYQTEGIQALQDASNYVRFDVYFDGSSIVIFSASMLNDVPTVRVNATIPVSAAPVWLRLNRTGNTWTGSWSTNGANYTTAATYTQALTISSVGPFVGNAGDPVPAFTALVDYFYNAASPGSGNILAQLGPVNTNSGGQPQTTQSLVRKLSLR
ncbi:MAG: DUF1349 domain-containing protein, partial [Bryobacteraceae bacterium]